VVRARKRESVGENLSSQKAPQKSLKRLGVFFNSRFSFAKHAENVISKAKKASSAIGRLGSVLEASQVKQ
jgi:hypothetical protein